MQLDDKYLKKEQHAHVRQMKLREHRQLVALTHWVCFLIFLRELMLSPLPPPGFV